MIIVNDVGDRVIEMPAWRLQGEAVRDRVTYESGAV